MTVNGEHAKPHRLVREGDRIRISRGFGRHQDVVVRIVLDQHVKKSEARVLFDDVTPKPTDAEIEMRPRRARVSCRGAGGRHARSPATARNPTIQGKRLTRIARCGTPV